MKTELRVLFYSPIAWLILIVFAFQAGVEFCTQIADLLRQPELDFVIGSIHNLSPQAGGEDFYYADYTDPAVCAAALDNYIASLEALAPRPELYDVLGHIIYPLRYMPPEASLAPFWDRISALLRTAVQYGRGIELNTCRGTTVAEWRELLALYRSLGGEIITVGDVRILPRSWKVYKGERELRLPNREFELLKFLAENPNIVFSTERLFETIWGYDYVGDSATVTVHIGRIREKIEDDPSRPKIIETVWGAGYRLNRQPLSSTKQE